MGFVEFLDSELLCALITRVKYNSGCRSSVFWQQSMRKVEQPAQSQGGLQGEELAAGAPHFALRTAQETRADGRIASTVPPSRLYKGTTGLVCPFSAE